jgi:hypothetical protein
MMAIPLFKSRPARIVFGVTGALILGALSNGVWEALFKPSMVWLRDAILTVGTLGIQSLIDSVYFDVGKAGYERASVEILDVFIACFILLFISTIFIAIGNIRNPSGLRTDNAEQDERSRRQFWRVKIYFILPVFILAAVIMLFRFTSIIYEIEASTNLERYQSIIAPYISEQERLNFRSRVAQIHTRAEFLTLIGDMKLIIETNKLYDPAIAIF